MAEPTPIRRFAQASKSQVRESASVKAIDDEVRASVVAMFEVHGKGIRYIVQHHGLTYAQFAAILIEDKQVAKKQAYREGARSALVRLVSDRRMA